MFSSQTVRVPNERCESRLWPAFGDVWQFRSFGKRRVWSASGLRGSNPQDHIGRLMVGDRPRKSQGRSSAFNFMKGVQQMLVLSRKKDEAIVIGDNIRIVIVEVRGDKVRIGIEAPKDVSVHRKEIYEAIQREKAGAT